MGLVVSGRPDLRFADGNPDQESCESPSGSDVPDLIAAAQDVDEEIASCFRPELLSS